LLGALERLTRFEAPRPRLAFLHRVGVDELLGGVAHHLARPLGTEELARRRVGEDDLATGRDQDGFGGELDQTPVTLLAGAERGLGGALGGDVLPAPGDPDGPTVLVGVDVADGEQVGDGVVGMKDAVLEGEVAAVLQRLGDGFADEGFVLGVDEGKEAAEAGDEGGGIEAIDVVEVGRPCDAVGVDLPDEAAGSGEQFRLLGLESLLLRHDLEFAVLRHQPPFRSIVTQPGGPGER
jgi:hypothetical protein